MDWEGKGFKGIKKESVRSKKLGNCDLLLYAKEIDMELLGMSATCLKPGEWVKPHNHKIDRQLEVYYLVRGKGQIIIDGKEIDVEQDTAFYLEPEQERWVKNNTDEECCWLFIGPRPSLGPGPNRDHH
jgi:mannose-6-phosphate isomerase-like protein (cupin superfamily)